VNYHRLLASLPAASGYSFGRYRHVDAGEADGPALQNYPVGNIYI
jgi:hypothetical protein